MKEIIGTARGLLGTPWLYLYWAIAAVGVVTSHLNSGAKGSPGLGATSILCSLACIALFYWHLCRLRNQAGFSPTRTAGGLFLSILGFRLRILALFLPCIFLFFLLGTFDSFTRAYIAMTVATGEARGHALVEVMAVMWPWILAFFAFLALDQTGRSQVVAQGNAKGSLKAAFVNVLALKKELGIFLLIKLVLLAIDLGDFATDPLEARDHWGMPVVRVLMTPIGYLVNMVSLLYMASRLR